MRPHFRITNTFASNAFEGNRLTVMETKLVLEDGITAGKKRLDDHLETVSHGKAFDLMLELARGNTLDTISKKLLLIASDRIRSRGGLGKVPGRWPTRGGRQEGGGQS
ncbi:MAG: hypothetical protein LBQ12_03460 [Deltaproteobacteria bacterium]|nr:hypothetical protein [Deltaproteobacteria bacterium]